MVYALLLIINEQTIQQNIQQFNFQLKMTNKNIGRARILQQLKNMQKDKVQYLHAQPLQTDLYTWHFTFRGPENTDFHQGLYHGQIILPFEYPFKPPDIIFANKNGRFEVNTKICLTITQYHTQQWNSAWTIRTMLEAVISLFNQRVVGHGYLQSSSDARKFFAKASHDYTCEKCGKISDVIKPRPPMVKTKQNQLTIQQKASQLKEHQYEYHQKQQQSSKVPKSLQKFIQQRTQAIRKPSNSSQAEKLNQNIKKQNNQSAINIQSKDFWNNKNKYDGKEENLQDQYMGVNYKINYQVPQIEEKKKKQKMGKNKNKKISPQQFFYYTLMQGNQEYKRVIKSKKLIMQ